MFYQVCIELKNGEPYEIWGDTYCKLCNRINDDLFNGYNVIKLQTLKCSMKKGGVNHIKNIIPSFDIKQYKKRDFKTIEEYKTTLGKCI